MSLSRKLILILLLLITSLGLSGCLNKTAPGALKVNATPNAKIWVDGVEVGTTPYTNDSVEPGEIVVKLESLDGAQPGSWESIVEIRSSVFTVINRQLGTSEEKNGGEVLTMQPTNQSVASLAVVSKPAGAMIKIDGQTKGPTPLDIGQIAAGNHQIQISSPGYEDRTVAIDAQVGYKLIVDVNLVKQEVGELADDLNVPNDATDSGETADPNNGTAETEEDTTTDTEEEDTTSEIEGDYVEILSTPTGWLRVRKDATVNSSEVARVNPGDRLPLVDEQDGWYQIEYDGGEQGWISGQYAEKFTDE